MFYDSTYLTIQRLRSRFSEYEENYASYLLDYVTYTDGTEIHFIQNEIEIFDDIAFLWKALCSDDGLKGNYRALEIEDEYVRYRDELHNIQLTCFDRLEYSTARKIEFLNKRLKELGISRQVDFFDLIADEDKEPPKGATLNEIMLFLYYLDKHGHLSLKRIHPDNKHLAIILSFLTGKSQNTISQKLSKFNLGLIQELKEVKGSLQALDDFLAPYGDAFPEVVNEIKNDIKKRKK